MNYSDILYLILISHTLNLDVSCFAFNFYWDHSCYSVIHSTFTQTTRTIDISVGIVSKKMSYSFSSSFFWNSSAIPTHKVTMLVIVSKFWFIVTYNNIMYFCFMQRKFYLENSPLFFVFSDTRCWCHFNWTKPYKFFSGISHHLIKWLSIYVLFTTQTPQVFNIHIILVLVKKHSIIHFTWLNFISM